MTLRTLSSDATTDWGGYLERGSYFDLERELDDDAELASTA